nr:MAG TPA: hypothetical protein [Caudoviricetes sp.]
MSDKPVAKTLEERVAALEARVKALEIALKEKASTQDVKRAVTRPKA